MKFMLNSLLLLAAAAAGTRAADLASLNRLTDSEKANGTILLFDGTSLFGWEATSKANWTVEEGEIRVDQGEKGFLRTTSPYLDFELTFDFFAADTTNSGVFLRMSPKVSDPARDCYELNIANPSVSPFSTGGFVGRMKTNTPLAVNGDNRWHQITVTASGKRFAVNIDGQPVLDYVDEEPLPAGPIGLQYNVGPIRFRNIKLKPLGLQPLFNGRDLSNWTIFPGKKSEFSVTDAGELRVFNGPGGIESKERFADFILQLEVKTNGTHLNSGIFFRSIPGEFWNGYESQIRHEYKDGDRTKPVDAGTGAIYRRQDARVVMGDDFRWVPMTINAAGNHFAVWVDGYPVTDWTDQRPADPNPRKGYRAEAGTIILQGHDPTTDILFRNMQIERLKQ